MSYTNWHYMVPAPVCTDNLCVARRHPCSLGIGLVTLVGHDHAAVLSLVVAIWFLQGDFCSLTSSSIADGSELGTRETANIDDGGGAVWSPPRLYTGHRSRERTHLLQFAGALVHRPVPLARHWVPI